MSLDHAWQGVSALLPQFSLPTLLTSLTSFSSTRMVLLAHKRPSSAPPPLLTNSTTFLPCIVFRPVPGRVAPRLRGLPLPAHLPGCQRCAIMIVLVALRRPPRCSTFRHSTICVLCFSAACCLGPIFLLFYSIFAPGCCLASLPMHCPGTGARFSHIDFRTVFSTQPASVLRLAAGWPARPCIHAWSFMHPCTHSVL
jgi:hypothetical protein